MAFLYVIVILLVRRLRLSFNFVRVLRLFGYWVGGFGIEDRFGLEEI